MPPCLQAKTPRHSEAATAASSVAAVYDCRLPLVPSFPSCTWERNALACHAVASAKAGLRNSVSPSGRRIACRLHQATYNKARGYFFFFPPGNTLATALAIDPATFATTPFFAARFFAFGFVEDFDFDFVVRAFGAVFVFAFFFAAVFAITDSATCLPFS
jgi:hypothetical protein